MIAEGSDLMGDMFTGRIADDGIRSTDLLDKGLDCLRHIATLCHGDNVDEPLVGDKELDALVAS